MNEREQEREYDCPWFSRRVCLCVEYVVLVPFSSHLQTPPHSLPSALSHHNRDPCVFTLGGPQCSELVLHRRTLTKVSQHALQNMKPNVYPSSISTTEPSLPGCARSSVLQIDETFSDVDDYMVYIDEAFSDVNNPGLECFLLIRTSQRLDIHFHATQLPPTLSSSLC